MKISTNYIVWVGIFVLLTTLAACGLQQDASKTDTPVVIPTEAPPPATAPAEKATNTDGADTIFIPGGTFLMGSVESDTLAGTDEFPDHTVTLDSFYIYTHEVTNAMYDACIAAGACTPAVTLPVGSAPRLSDPAYADHPVVGVNWTMAADYCTWAGGRLPTEAEWEYAARGADSLVYPWGADAPNCDLTNMSGCTSPAGTAAVGSRAAGNSPFGVWDLSGNVWEWTQDWYAEAFYYFSPAENPFGPSIPQDSANPLKTVRGGSLYSAAALLRGAVRLGLPPARVYDNVGFRCAASVPLALPEDYEAPDPGIEIPQDGQNADTPGTPAENWLKPKYAYATCPYEGDKIRVDLRLDFPEGTTFTLKVEGNPFECVYDPPLNKWHCTGPLPANYDSLAKMHLEVLATFPDGSTATIPGFHVAAQHDCEEAVEPSQELSAEVGCPEEGFVTVRFHYDPAHVIWQEVYLRSMDTPLPCQVTGEGELTCVSPNLPEDGLYKFYLYGENDQGLGRKWWPDLPAPEDCPAAPGELAIGYETLCWFAPHPTIEFHYDQTIHGSVRTVQDGGEFRIHVNWAEGVTESLFTDETPGHVTTMTLCFQDGYCQDVPDITVPDCSTEDGNTERGYTIDSVCYAPEAEVVFSPAISLQYWPTDQMLASVTANGSPLTCYEMGEGWFACAVLPGEPGDNVDIQFCLANNECHNGTATVNECPTGVQSEWTMVSNGCHEWPDGNYVFFVLDTGYDWLTLDADVNYTATDGVRTFACVTHPLKAGQIYCYGLKPSQPGTMNVCIQRAGYADDCRSFADYYNWVSALSCPAFTCNGLDQATCSADSRCQWVTKISPTGSGNSYCTGK